MVLHQLGSEELALQFENPNLNEMFYLTAEKALESVSMSAEHSLMLINNDETDIKEDEISKLILTFFEQLSVLVCFVFNILRVCLSVLQTRQINFVELN